MAMQVLTRDVEDVKGRLGSITGIIADLADLKLQVSQLYGRIDDLPDYSEAISKLQKDMRSLYVKLGVSGNILLVLTAAVLWCGQ